MSTLAALQEALSTVGGSLALAFIVAIALGICATTALFMGSAAVVLERFARAVQRPGSVVVATLVGAGLLGALGADVETMEAAGLPWRGTLAAWGLASLAALPLLVLAQALVAALLRFVPPAGLGLAAVAVLGTGLGLFVGGLDQPGYGVAPLAVAALAWGALRLRRQRAGGEAPRLDERLARLLVVVLAVGAVLPLLLARPRPEVSALGAAAMLVMAGAVVLGLLPLAAAGLLDTRGSAEWFIARRYLFAKRRQTFISVITLICVAGVAAGVWLIITVLSVMNGFESVWRDEIIGNRAHLTVRSPLGPIEDYREVLERLEDVPDVVGASPFVDAQGMVRGDHGEIFPVSVHGVDPGLVGTVTDLREDLLPGSEDALSALGPVSDGEDPGILVGSQLAGHLGIGLGDPLLLVSPFGGPPTPLGPGPRLARFRVVGVFRSSFFQYDEVYTYVGLEAAQDFRRLGDAVDGIEVRTTDYYRSRAVGEQIEELLGFPYYTQDWKEFFPAFFQALKTERVMMFVLLTMIMVVAAFAIVVTLVMMIMEKSSDIAILKAMGATDASVERIFAIEGTLIGLLGTVVGVVSGIAVTTQLAWVQSQIEALTGVDTLPANIYQFSKLPWEIDPGQLATVVALAMVLSLGATLLPSRHGARLDPAEALRYE